MVWWRDRRKRSSFLFSSCELPHVDLTASPTVKIPEKTPSFVQFSETLWSLLRVLLLEITPKYFLGPEDPSKIIIVVTTMDLLHPNIWVQWIGWSSVPEIWPLLLSQISPLVKSCYCVDILSGQRKPLTWGTRPIFANLDRWGNKAGQSNKRAMALYTCIDMGNKSVTGFWQPLRPLLPPNSLR